MNKSLIVVLAALALAPAAVAATIWPSNAKVDAAVTAIAHHPVAVTCYQDAAAWNEAVHTAFGEQQDDYGARTGANTLAFTPIGGSQTYWSPVICRTLFFALRVGPLKANRVYIGGLIDVLSHESVIAGGSLGKITDPSQTEQYEQNVEACAKKDFALATHALFGVKYHTVAMRLIVNSALDWSSQLAYGNGGSC